MTPRRSGSGLVIVTPGLQTTVQDLGRWGFQSFGVPVAGAMDARAHRIANALVGNHADAATLEVTLTGPDIEFEDARVVAVSGAIFDLMLDSNPVLMNAPFEVTPGSRLTFGPRSAGARACVAISGGIDVPKVFGSRATHVASRMGGLDGRPLAAGDRLPVGESSQEQHERPRPELPRLPIGHARLRVLPGPQRDRFTDDAIEVLQSAPYLIRSDSDRMAIRLEGPALRHSRGADIISDATSLGALQVSASGQPMLLMADRQTTGGYPKIATVISADVAVAAQLAPGDTLSFEVCTIQAALAALIAEERPLMGIETRP